MSKSQSKATAKRTRTVDYTPEEMRAARDLAVKAGRAYQRHVKTGEGTLLVQCVEATREALHVRLLVDGREKDRPEQSMTGKAYAGFFGLSSGSEVSFWSTLAKALDSGVSVGDDTWMRLATRQGPMLAKRTEVRKVIDGGGSIADIEATMDAVKAKSTAGRAARPASEKSAGESADAGITPSADPVADAHLALQGLDAALKRITNDADGYAAWDKIRHTLQALARRENTLRKAHKPSEAAA